MDTVHAAGQAQTVASPLPVQNRRPAQGTVEKRAVEAMSHGVAPNTEDRHRIFEPGAAVVQLVRDFAQHLAEIIDRTANGDADESQSASGPTAPSPGPEHVDVYV